MINVYTKIMEGKLSKFFISEVCNTHLYQTSSSPH